MPLTLSGSIEHSVELVISSNTSHEPGSDKVNEGFDAVSV